MADGLEMSAPVNCTDGLHGAAVLAPRGSLSSHVLFSTLMLLGRWAYPDSKLVLLLAPTRRWRQVRPHRSSRSRRPKPLMSTLISLIPDVDVLLVALTPEELAEIVLQMTHERRHG